MPSGDLIPSSHGGLDLFVGTGPSLEECIAAIGGVLGLEDAQFVGGEELGALVAAIERATIGWVVCHRSDHSKYPLKFDIDLIDGRLPIDAMPDIVQRLGVAVVVPNNESNDPHAGLLFDPEGAVRPFSLLALED